MGLFCGSTICVFTVDPAPRTGRSTKFLGDKTAAYGGSLTFDLRSEQTNDGMNYPARSCMGRGILSISCLPWPCLPCPQARVVVDPLQCRALGK